VELLSIAMVAVGAYLKHGEQKVLFSALVLVSVDGKHDGLQKLVDFGHGDQATQMCNVSRLTLQEKEQIAVFLRLFIIGKSALGQVGRVVQVAGDLFFLSSIVRCLYQPVSILTDCPYLFQSHAILHEQSNSRVEISHILLQHEILFGLR
jgi:hypothetical protein